MAQELHFIPFRSCSDNGWSEAWQIYTDSFPPNEKWFEQDYARAFDDPRFEADGIWLGEQFAGILFHWQAPGCRYVEHLAISPTMRGQNMGSRALRAFCEQVGCVILEIDPPQDEISIRRQHFYQRLGFHTNPYEYIHPSFHEPYLPHKLVLMSYPQPITYAQASSFADFVREVVLSYSGHEQPTLPKLP